MSTSMWLSRNINNLSRKINGVVIFCNGVASGAIMAQLAHRESGWRLLASSAAANEEAISSAERRGVMALAMANIIRRNGESKRNGGGDAKIWRLCGNQC